MRTPRMDPSCTDAWKLLRSLFQLSTMEGFQHLNGAFVTERRSGKMMLDVSFQRPLLVVEIYCCFLRSARASFIRQVLSGDSVDTAWFQQDPMMSVVELVTKDSAAAASKKLFLIPDADFSRRMDNQEYLRFRLRVVPAEASVVLKLMHEWPTITTVSTQALLLFRRRSGISGSRQTIAVWV